MGCFCSAYVDNSQQVSAVLFLPFELSGSRPGFQRLHHPQEVGRQAVCKKKKKKALRALQSLDISQGLPKPSGHCGHND